MSAHGPTINGISHTGALLEANNLDFDISENDAKSRPSMGNAIYSGPISAGIGHAISSLIGGWHSFD